MLNSGLQLYTINNALTVYSLMWLLEMCIRDSKKTLRSVKFNSTEEVKEKVQNCRRHQDKEFFAEGIKKLVKRWDKCIDVVGDYVEK